VFEKSGVLVRTISGIAKDLNKMSGKGCSKTSLMYLVKKRNFHQVDIAKKLEVGRTQESK